MNANKITGASVPIVNYHEPIILKHFGYADKSNKTLVNDSTLFKIVSITKIFLHPQL